MREYLARGAAFPRVARLAIPRGQCRSLIASFSRRNPAKVRPLRGVAAGPRLRPQLRGQRRARCGDSPAGLLGQALHGPHISRPAPDTAGGVRPGWNCQRRSRSALPGHGAGLWHGGSCGTRLLSPLPGREGCRSSSRESKVTLSPDSCQVCAV